MNYDIDTLVALKEEFQSNEFQWIKTQDRSKLGKLVEVRDIIPISGDRFVALLSDGTRIDTDQISSNLMMVNDDQPALSLAQVQSLNYVPTLSDSDAPVDPSLPADFRNNQQPGQTPRADGTATLIQAPNRIQVDTTDLFGMFSLEETDLVLTIRVQLPEKNLLKMMYSNSKDKDSFLTKLSNYINNTITPDSIRSTVEKLLGGSKKKKSDESN